MSAQDSRDINPHRVDAAMTNHLDQSTGNPTSASVEQVNGVKASLSELGRRDSSESAEQKPKQSTFKITSVTLHRQKGSSQDGRHSFGEDDEESAVEDSLVQTDVEDSPAPAVNLAAVVKPQQPQQRHDQRQDRVDSTSRFKVVKIQKREPYNVGRWRISDYMSADSDLAGSKVNPEVNNHKKPSSESGNSSRASSTHYVHGVDDPSKNPLANITNVTNASTVISHQPQASIQPQSHTPAVVQGFNHVNVQDSTGQADRGQPHNAPHINNYSSTNEKVDNISIHIGGDKPGTQLLQPHDGHGISGPGVIASQLGNAATVINRATIVQPAAQLPVNSTVHIPQHVTNMDPMSTAPTNTQITTLNPIPHTASTTGVGGGGGVPLSAINNADTQPSTTDHLKPPDNVQGAGVAAATGTTAAAVPTASTQVKDQQTHNITNLQDTQEQFGGVRDLVANLTELVDPAAAAGGAGEQADADAAATGVAIDNKIEQAMDLVKSHLMLAVREEVEDLKLQITKLLERNSLLEQENKLLKSSASPETIAQLALLNRQQNH